MASGPATSDAPPLDEIHELILRRVRIGLGIILAGVLISMISNPFLAPARPAWAYRMDMLGMALVALAFLLLTRPAIRRHPVPFAPAGRRADVRHTRGIGHLVRRLVADRDPVRRRGDDGRRSPPVGRGAPARRVVLAGGAIAANAYLIGGDPNAQTTPIAVPVAIALGVSVVLAYELQRHRRQLGVENLRRQRAEVDLARLNTELEQRVAERTAALAAATSDCCCHAAIGARA